MSAKPEVSIIIPVLNRTTLLGKTIESVISQSYSNWELIVVDDGSTEDVECFVGQYRDPRIVFIRQENLGNAVARNTGYKLSKGEFIAFLDSDDLWHTSALQTMVSTLLEHPKLHVVYSRFVCIDAEGNSIDEKIGPPPVQGDLLIALLLGHPIPPSSALIRRQALEEWGGFTPGLDDWELWLRWAASGVRFEGIAQPYVYYRMHSQNFNLDWENRSKVHFEMLDVFYKQENLPLVALQMRDQVYARQHFHFAILAWQVGKLTEAMREFTQAVHKWPSYLQDLDFFTQVACAHQDWLERGTAVHFKFPVGKETLLTALDTLFLQVALPGEISSRRAAAYGWGYFALARLAYSYSQKLSLVRKCLLASFKSWPAIVIKSDWILWWARALVGTRYIQAIKKPLNARRELSES